MTDAVIDVLRLRGDRAARLARVAATTLPRALERALADVDDCSIGCLHVSLDVEQSADDETIAALWAAAIRNELLAGAGVGVAERSEPVTSGEVPGAGPGLPLALAATAAREWLASREPRAPLSRAVVSALAGALGGESLAVARARGTSPADAPLTSAADLASLAASVLAALRSPGGSPAVIRQPHGEPSGNDSAGTSVGQARGKRATPPPHARPAHTEPLPREEAQREAVAAQLSALAELAAPEAVISPHCVTRAGGLALVYPWLADVARLAMELHPGHDEEAVRAIAIAAVIDPADEELRNDPLVRVLAGATAPCGATAALPHASEVVAAADHVVASFARMLPGFEESSTDFVRAQWLARLGLVDDAADPVRLIAETHPLDVVLARLPYPVSLFRLPWSPPVLVRFRP